MDIDIGFWLTLAVLVCGSIWLVDRFSKLRDKAPARVTEAVEFSNSLLPVFVIVLVVRSFIVEPFTIPSGSMLPTLKVHDFILVNRFAYGLRLPVTNTRIIPVSEPERGDVMVFRFPRDRSLNFIKRVVGLPGDRVAVRSDRVYINGEQVPVDLRSEQITGRVQEKVFVEQLGDKAHLMRQEAPINPYTGKPVPRGKDGEWQVPQGHYFVMGDNRDNSNDSRFWGFVPDELVLGKAFLIWMHWESLFSLPEFDRNGAIDKVEQQEAEQ
jgi:signal peptidase I